MKVIDMYSDELVTYVNRLLQHLADFYSYRYNPDVSTNIVETKLNVFFQDLVNGGHIEKFRITIDQNTIHYSRMQVMLYIGDVNCTHFGADFYS